MFNVRTRATFPWLYVEPPPAKEMPGFRMNSDGSMRNKQPEAASGFSGFGAPLGSLTEPYTDAAQPVLTLPSPSAESLAQSPPPTGTAGFRAEPRNNVPGFNVRPDTENALPDLIASGSDAQRQEMNMFVEPRPESAASLYLHAAPTPTTPSLEDLTSFLPSQLSELLYNVVTMPVPHLSTAVDPRTGRRIVPYEPLSGPIRSCLVTNPTALGSDNARRYGTSPLPNLSSAEAPSGERGLSDTPMWPANITATPDATTELPANFEPPLQPPMDGWPYTEAAGAKRGAPSPPVLVPQPTDPTSPSFVRPIADTNFILADASDEQRMPPPQDQPTEVKNLVKRPEALDRPPEQQTEKALSRALEDHRRATADQIDELVGTIATYGTRIYEDSILKARDDLGSVDI